MQMCRQSSSVVESKRITVIRNSNRTSLEIITVFNVEIVLFSLLDVLNDYDRINLHNLTRYNITCYSKRLGKQNLTSC